VRKARKKYFVHETAVVDEPVSIGEGTKIWHFSHIMAGAKIGKGCSIGQNVYIGATAEIGDNVKIQNNVSVYEGVVIEDSVFCGPSCVFTNVIRPRSAFPRIDRTFDTTIVRKGATIGANASIVCGITIGEHSFIGAGSVVTKDVPAYALCFGNPARRRGWICECGGKLDDSASGSKNLVCSACPRKYRKKGKRIERLEG
jgi:UDP-2-acetamido-3-amino-2,3-dideoxy-glucuronate N-acetyltransferase